MIGQVVVDERYRFAVVRISLREGMFTIHADMVGSHPALSEDFYQVVLSGEDGTEVARWRTKIGWDETVDGAVHASFPVLLTEISGAKPW